MKTSTRRKSLRNLAVRVGAAVLIVGIGGSLAMATTASAESSTTVVGLRLGSTGYAVAVVQQALQAHGFPPPGGVDGTFGDGTDKQVRAFQKANGLTVSGTIDAKTAKALGLSDTAGSDGSGDAPKPTTPPSTSSPAPSPSPVAKPSIKTWTGLSAGASGPAVKSLQARLIEVGVPVAGGADGFFGDGTTKAVSAYQIALGLTSTGSVGVQTATALVEGRKYKAPKPAGISGGTSPTLKSLVGLRIGSTGPAVKMLQQRLAKAGISIGGGADGIYGALTASAVRTFQSASGLSATGAVDQATARAILKLGPAASLKLTGLARGAQGAPVIHLQNLLIAVDMRVSGGVDGVFGPATESAVRSYQAATGSKVSGVVDQTTAANLLRGAKGSSAQPAGNRLVGLKAGALGPVVTQLQQRLIKLGISVRGGADGIFGPATASALRTFQTSQDLAATGVVDKATVKALANPKPIKPARPVAPGKYPAYGEQSKRVTALQKALQRAGISIGGGVDGQFGAKTTAAVAAFQRKVGLPVTGKVDARTAKALGLQAMNKPSDPAPSSLRIKAFPVEPACGYVNTWGAPRSGGRSHIGVDILAATGNKEYAVVDGTITKVYTDFPGSLAGNGVRLSMPDGTYFFYAHMSRLADGIGVGTPVKAGQVIGYVGATGNAGVPHLHFEAHPGGGSAVNPYHIVKAVNAC